ncbi:hypothetical protein CONPUDRAFT_166822 [Coniophora puteana RWD-64-598 SS2]|uniref:Transcription factor hoxa13 n=1 Tax=Coniophora puteana (strain RWD-64-598) TaxID=741705 RepID=A0A5M3MIW7_CONPW|nr:uncharacterized protein CONPUDRAFT_166822 [Coniophora puteana RWD-64-598 SS2]EIW78976.1 hypothetical protein CONPUDRAFT_166822 [Coniophora puteana RWD-64-598 SS2]
MVVTRRTPVVPPPPTSRTSSQQALPRTTHTRPQDDTTPTPSPLANGDHDESHDESSPPHINGHAKDGPNSRKANVKQKEKAKAKKRGFFDTLWLLMFTAFAAYTLTTCPYNESSDSLVCRGLSGYRDIVIEPYILPSLYAALDHPSVAPYVEKVRPVYVASKDIFDTRVAPQWNRRVVPAFYNHMLPRWHAHVVPVWTQHGAPLWDAHVIARYDALVAPHLHAYVYGPWNDKIVPVWTQHAAPRLVAARAFYVDKARPAVDTAVAALYRWQRASRPYVARAAEQSKKLAPVVRVLVERLAVLVEFLAAQRRTFVDPHVSRIWEKVVELSSSGGGASLHPDSQGTRTSSSIVAEPEADAGAKAESVLRETLMPEGTPEAIPIASLIFDPSASEGSQTASVPQGATPSTAEQHAEPTRAPSAAAPSLPSEPEEIDLDAFYEELGFASPTEPAETRSSSALPPLAQRTAAAAAPESESEPEQGGPTRDELRTRHDAWEAQLQAQIGASFSSLRLALSALREHASEELSGLDDRRGVEPGSGTGAGISGVVDALERDAERYVRGARKYLKGLVGDGKAKAKGGNANGGAEGGKEQLWARMVDRVEQKFEERAMEAEGQVNAWWVALVDAELAEVAKAAQAVRAVAEKAQGDMAMDYAYLDDVTYLDWQRYHALMDTSDKFTDEMRALQNGTSLANPVVTVLEGLESEVNDVLLGFDAQIRALRQEGQLAIEREAEALAAERVAAAAELPFAGEAEDQDQDQKAEAVTRVPVPEEKVEELVESAVAEVVEEGPESESDDEEEGPEVVILPVDPLPEQPAAEEVIPPVVIGRGKEEILEAFGRADPESIAVKTPRSTEAQGKEKPSVREHVEL